jgi:hypothetical protein
MKVKFLIAISLLIKLISILEQLTVIYYQKSLSYL